jgi:D-tagatose-1,6-bisphosphate aldolase subunit GatZ/KbaZ
LTITDPASAAQVIDLSREAFHRLDLKSAWERVMALVVQPGVEFGDQTVHAYHGTACQGLARFIEGVPGMVFEAHSTDYQTRSALKAMVEDHFAILKVGPWMTFALREAVFALASIEEILTPYEGSHIREILEEEMLQNPGNWNKHYSGTAAQLKISRAYSFSDRIRYYWNRPKVQNAFNRLMHNLGGQPLPLSFISQFFPDQYLAIREGLIPNHPRDLLLGKVARVLDDYAFACGT